MTVFLVEDEPPLLRDLAAAVEGSACGWQVAGTARNGRLAWEFLETCAPGTLPDLVIADIRMPSLDGLELTRRLKLAHPSVAVVILSGYQDFEYARTALRLGVRDYLLKPLSPASLVQVLGSVELWLSNQRGERLQQWLLGRILPDDAEMEGRMAPLKVVSLVAGNVVDPQYSGFLPASALWNRVSVDTLVREIWVGRPVWVIEGFNTAELVLLVAQTQAPEPSDAERRLVEGLSGQGVPIVAVSSLCTQPARLLRSVHAAHREQVLNQFVPGGSGCVQAPPGQARTNSAPPLSGIETLVTRALTTRQEELLGSVLESLAKEWTSLALTQSQVRRRFQALTAQVNPSEPWDLEAVMASAFEVGGLMSAWRIVLADALPGRTPTPQAVRDQMVQAAREYIERHFTEEITGEQLSKRVGIGSSYLSKLFKEALGQTPVEYITRLRIDEAQRLLEVDSPVLIKDVAEAVGYPDQAYFSRVFHRLVGVWPSDFRSRLAKD